MAAEHRTGGDISNIHALKDELFEKLSQVKTNKIKPSFQNSSITKTRQDEADSFNRTPPRDRSPSPKSFSSSLEQQLKSSSTGGYHNEEDSSPSYHFPQYYSNSAIQEEDQFSDDNEDEIDPVFLQNFPETNERPQFEDVNDNQKHEEQLFQWLNIKDPSDPFSQSSASGSTQESYKYMVKDGETGQYVNPHQINDSIASNKKLLKKDKPNEQINNRKGSKNWDKWYKKQQQVNKHFARAAERNDIKQLKKIMKQSPSLNVNLPAHDDWTPLHYAVNEGNTEAVRFLLDNHARNDMKTQLNRTPLHLACNRGHNIVTQILIKHPECDINAQDSELNTALHLCSMYDHVECVRVVLKHGCKLDIRNVQGNTPLDVASSIKIAVALKNHIEQLEEQKIQRKSGGGSGETFDIDARNEQKIQAVNGYSRMQIGGVVRRTNRSDFIQRMLQKTGALGKQNLALRAGDVRKQNEDKVVEQQQEEKKEFKIVKIDNAPEEEDDGQQIRQNPQQEEKVGGALLNEAIKQRIKVLKSQENKVAQICIYDYSQEDHQQKESIGPSAFQPYQLLGKGSFGEVYLVRKRSDDQFYAMKVLKKKALKAQNLIRYAKTERNVLSITKHPFMVGLNYAFQTQEKLFLLLDYCQGGDLGKVIQRERRLHQDVVKAYCAQIILALEDLHKRDIIFRDLKPQNIVMDHQGHAMLTDFGLSKQGVHDFSNRTFCGSVAYLAPQMLQRRGHGKSIDWYLLGVLMYQMLFGHPPFFSYNRDTLFRNILKAPLNFPKKISRSAQDLLQRLMQRDPKMRLGAKQDGTEIKRHPFFYGIDWKKAMKRQLIVPKPKLNEICKKKLPPTALIEFKMYEQQDDEIFQPKKSVQPGANVQIDNWSFVRQSHIEQA